MLIVESSAVRKPINTCHLQIFGSSEKSAAYAPIMHSIKILPAVPTFYVTVSFYNGH